MAVKKNSTGSPEKEESQIEPSNVQVESPQKEIAIEVVTRTEQPLKNPNDVEFLVEYSKDYKGKKIVPEGITIVSKETAELFESRGMGIKVK